MDIHNLGCVTEDHEYLVEKRYEDFAERDGSWVSVTHTAADPQVDLYVQADSQGLHLHHF